MAAFFTKGFSADRDVTPRQVNGDPADPVPILVVDDSPTNRMVLERMALAPGRIVHLAESAAEALELEHLVDMIRNAMEEARRIQNDLHPAYLDIMGVKETLRDFCKRFQTTYKNIRTSLRLELSEDDIPDHAKEPVFRIVQEAMHNASKHGRPTEISVRMRIAESRLELLIQDNGVGFESAGNQPGRDSAGGLGLVSMQERAKLSGGSLEIRSAPRAGTAILARWPLAINA